VSGAQGAFCITERGLFFVSFPEGETVPVQTSIQLNMSSRIAVVDGQLVAAATSAGLFALNCFVRSSTAVLF
jgi:hypothetical protein